MPRDAEERGLCLCFVMQALMRGAEAPTLLKLLRKDPFVVF